MTEQEIVKKLRQEAESASTRAYAPYSGFHIGSAIMTGSGKIYSGCNVENSSYGATVCAERTAIFKAVSEGERTLTHVYVYSKGGWPPCGMCRQVIAEFATPGLKVVMGNDLGEETTMTFKEIFPLAFTPEHLGK